jgi:hypothetical protein
VLQQDTDFRELIADPDTDLGLDPSWVQIYPYQAIAVRGRPVALEVRARNYRKHDVALEVTLCLPQGWRSTPLQLSLVVPAGGMASAKAKLSVPMNWPGADARHAIAADVIADNVYLGQIAEALVDVIPTHDRYARLLPDQHRDG